MQFLSSLIMLGSLATTSLAVMSCPAATTCKGLTALAASALKGHPPAESLCTQKFPAPRRTCADTALAVTISSTVADRDNVTMARIATTIECPASSALT
jgi:hypothetical protein